MITMKRLTFAVVTAAIVLAGCGAADVAATVDDREITRTLVYGIRTDVQETGSISSAQIRGDLSRLIFTAAMLNAAEEDFGLTDLDTPETHEAYMAQATPEEQDLIANYEAEPGLSASAVEVVKTQMVLFAEVQAALNSPPESAQADMDAWIISAINRSDVSVRSDIGVWLGPESGIAPPPPSP